ncbi:MAG: ADOP family duplicated permease [Gemmatimonadaceae bacterium]
MPSNDRARPAFRLPWRSARHISSDVDDELRFHLEMRTAELIAGGMSAGDARREATREFGDLEFTRRYCRRLDEGGERATRRGEWLSDLGQDVTQSLRALRRSPGFLFIALVTVALGVGANSAIFTVVRGVLLRPLPFAQPAQLVSVYEDNRPDHSRRSQLSAADYVDYRRDQTTLTDIGAVGYAGLAYQGDGDPIALHGLRFSPNVFGILGVRPLLGRTFAPDEDTPGRNAVIVLSYSTWRDAFGGDSSVVGRTVQMSGMPMTIVGVMPPSFTFGGDEQFWTPFVLQRQLADVNRARKLHNMVGVARLRPGSTIEKAESDLLTIAHRNERAYPAANTGHLVMLVPLRAAFVGEVRPALLVLSGAAACVLLIACANLANLLFSRTLGRQRELAVRAALGAGRGRLVRQLLTESLLLAIAGGAVGSVVGWAATKALLSVAPDALPAISKVQVDPTVVAFALFVSVGGGVLFGLVPAWLGARTEAERTLRETSGAVAGRRSDRMRRLLVAAQMSLTVVLLVGAALLVRSLQRVQQVELGIDAQSVLLANVSLPNGYDRVSGSRFYESLFERMRTAPGVQAVGATSHVPLHGTSGAGLHIEGEPMPQSGLPTIGYTSVSDDFFRTFGIPLREGRSFTSQDAPLTRPRAVVLNEKAVKLFFKGRSPIGLHIQLGPDPNGPWYLVVGVAANVRQDGFDAEFRPIAYTSYRQEGETDLTIGVKTAGEPMRSMPLLRSAIRELDKSLPITGVTTMDHVVGGSLSRRRFSMLLLSVFAVVSLVLAVVGAYGVMAYTVSARTPELGVRIALGATTRDVLGLVVGQSIVTSALGIAVGIIAALLSARALRGLLYGIAPTDAPTFAAVIATLLTASLAAAFIPARRATRVDPVIALRRDG